MGNEMHRQLLLQRIGLQQKAGLRFNGQSRSKEQLHSRYGLLGHRS
jgi:hypothetical protein